jgi:predicted NBD/HSP70 family sugar kinase
MVAQAEKAARSGQSLLFAEWLEKEGELTPRDIGEAMRRGDESALDVIRRTGRLVGQTLAMLVSVLNPSLIVVGGGVSHVGNALLAEIRSAVYQRSLPLATRNLPVVLSELDDVAGVVGASVMAAEGVLAVRN